LKIDCQFDQDKVMSRKCLLILPLFILSAPATN